MRVREIDSYIVPQLELYVKPIEGSVHKSVSVFVVRSGNVGKASFFKILFQVPDFYKKTGRVFLVLFCIFQLIA